MIDTRGLHIGVKELGIAERERERFVEKKLKAIEDSEVNIERESSSLLSVENGDREHERRNTREVGP